MADKKMKVGDNVKVIEQDDPDAAVFYKQHGTILRGASDDSFDWWVAFPDDEACFNEDELEVL